MKWLKLVHQYSIRFLPGGTIKSAMLKVLLSKRVLRPITVLRTLVEPFFKSICQSSVWFIKPLEKPIHNKTASLENLLRNLWQIPWLFLYFSPKIWSKSGNRTRNRTQPICGAVITWERMCDRKNPYTLIYVHMLLIFGLKRFSMVTQERAICS